MPPERMRSGWRHVGMMAALLPGMASAQSHTLNLQPYLDLRSEVTDNVNAAPSGRTRKDVVNTVTPGLIVNAQRPEWRLTGSGQVTQTQYVRNSQPDRLLPTGSLSGQLGGERDPLGVMVGATVTQTRANFTDAASQTTTRGTYTDYRLSLSPYWRQAFNPQWSLLARAGGTWARSQANDPALAARAASHSTDSSVALKRAPQPLGLELNASSHRDYADGQDNATLAQDAIRAHLVWDQPELVQLSLILGQERTRVLLDSSTDPIYGARVRWPLSERSMVDVLVEKHGTGPTWRLDMNHRTPWLSFGLHSHRRFETSTASLGTTPDGMSLRDALSAMLTTRVTDPDEREKAVDALMSQRDLNKVTGTSSRYLYDLSAQQRDVTSGRVTLMGRRSLTTLTAGLNRSRPLQLNDGSSLSLLSGQVSHEYFLSLLLSQQLGPSSTVDLGAQVSKAYSYTTLGPVTAYTYGRDVTWTAAWKWRCSPSLSASLGARRLTQHQQAQTIVQHAAYAGLGYTF